LEPFPPSRHIGRRWIVLNYANGAIHLHQPLRQERPTALNIRAAIVLSGKSSGIDTGIAAAMAVAIPLILCFALIPKPRRAEYLDEIQTLSSGFALIPKPRRAE